MNRHLAALASAPVHCRRRAGRRHHRQPPDRRFESRRAPAKPEFRALYKELVEINTTLSVGSCTDAANAMKARLLAAGYTESQAQVIVPPDWPKHGNLIALLPGSDSKLKPLLLLAHIDVVEAKREDWVRDPFKLVEEDGFFYARGSSDDKAMAAVFADSMVRFKKEELPAEARHQAGAHLRRGNAERVQRREVTWSRTIATSSTRRSRSTKAAAAATTRRPACIATSPCSRPRRSTRTSR